MKNPRRGKNEILYGKETPRGHHYGGRTARLIRTMRGTLFVDWDGLDDDPGMAQVNTEAAGRAFVDAWMADRSLTDSLQAAADAQRAAIKAQTNPRTDVGYYHGGTVAADGWVEFTRAQWNKVHRDFKGYALDWTEFGKAFGEGTPSIMGRDPSGGTVLLPVRIVDAKNQGRRPRRTKRNPGRGQRGNGRRKTRGNPGGGWRPYGPGKFDSMVDSFLWASTADGGDEELGESAGFGYYVLLDGHLVEAAEQGSISEGEEITPDELAELKTKAAAILSENSDGFVSAEYYDTQKEARAAWRKLELEYEKWSEGNEENPRRGRGRTHNPRTYTGAQYATPSAMKMVREWLGPPPYAKADVERVAKYMRDTLRVGGIRDCRALVIGAIQDAGLAVENPRGQRNPGGPRIVYNKLLGGWYVVVGPHQTPLNGRFNSKAEAQAWLSGRRTPNPRRELGVPDKHQLKIARATLKMSDAMARVMGGPTKAEARAIIRRLTGNVPRENPRAGSELARAKRTSEMWHEFPASKVTRMKGPPRVIPRHLVRLGEMTRLDYRSNKYEGRTRTYTHAFRRPRPVLATDPDGKNLHIVGGNVKVTADGLVN